MSSTIENFFLNDKGKKRQGRYTCRALFPGSVSSIHPHSMMLIVLNQFVKNDNKIGQKQNSYISDKIINEFSFDSEVKEDKSKAKLLNDWVNEDLCFDTISSKEGPFLIPFCLNVPDVGHISPNPFTLMWLGTPPFSFNTS